MSGQARHRLSSCYVDARTRTQGENMKKILFLTIYFILVSQIYTGAASITSHLKDSPISKEINSSG